MDKIQFDIKLRPEIEAGKYKVETRDGRPARIICWDRESNKYPIVALINCEGREHSKHYTCSGSFYADSRTFHDDLFLVPAEPELTEFEKCVKECLEYDPEVVSDGDLLEATKEYAKDLLAIARMELQPEKDLPRWKKCAPCDEDKATIPAWIVRFDAELAGESAVVHNGHYILFGDLERLPKED